MEWIRVHRLHKKGIWSVGYKGDNSLWKNMLMCFNGRSVEVVMGQIRREWCLNAYEMFNPRKPDVDWYWVIWNKYCVPKHNIICWFAIY